MLMNALKIAYRNLLRNKLYSLINIIGLAVGIACCLVIVLFVEDEWSYDRFNDKADRIYRMSLDRIYPDHNTTYAIIPASMGEAARDEFPEIQEMVRMWQFPGDVVFRHGEKIYEESSIMFADSSFFQVFSIPLLEGDPNTVLSQPNFIILTQSTAQRYFGDKDPIGETLETPQGTFQVTGVCGDVPGNSHFSFDFLVSMSTLGFVVNDKEYLSFSARTYLLLGEGADPDALEAKFPAMVEKYATGQIERRLGMSYKEYTEAGNGYHYFLQPLTDIHLRSHLEGEFKANGNIMYVWLFISIAFFILVIACINFMNLATARSSERAREVGIRKVLGSHRKQLIAQFLVEAILISSISIVLSVVLIRFMLPYFNNLAGKTLDLNFTVQWWAGPALFILAILIGLMAGSYPAFILSSFKPVAVLKGAFKSTRQGTNLRNGLVIFQFAISILLISSTGIIYQQMQYTRDKNLGFDKEEILVIERANSLQDKYETFRQELLRDPSVVNAGAGNAMPGGYYFGFVLKTGTNSEVFTGRGTFMDQNYIETLGLEITSGRSFSRSFNDTLSLIINESYARMLGFEDPVGRQVTNPGNTPEQNQIFTIIGVVKDFHYQSLHEKIGALAIQDAGSNQGSRAFIPVKIATDDVENTIAGIQNKWQALNAETPFRFHFLDQELNQMYQSEQVSGKVFATFSIIAILIACIGLFGLSTFLAQQKTKEVGIRKVLGASVLQLVVLLSREITILVFIAFFIAIPITWLLMDNWLDDFVYRITPGPGVFIAAGIISVMIAWLTVSYQSLKTAFSNPVNALRDE